MLKALSAPVEIIIQFFLTPINTIHYIKMIIDQSLYLLLICLVFLFHPFFEKENVHMHVNKGRVRERENLRQFSCPVQSVMQGLI